MRFPSLQFYDGMVLGQVIFQSKARCDSSAFEMEEKIEGKLYLHCRKLKPSRGCPRDGWPVVRARPNRFIYAGAEVDSLAAP